MYVCTYVCIYVYNAINSPLNTVWTVAKYEPMGTTIMAKVKASSLTMTSLVCHLRVSDEMPGQEQASKQAAPPLLSS